MKGLFIVMEGPDGSGKTTQINLLKEYLEEAGYECLITREPGGTVIGEEVRQLILNPEHKEMSPVTEMLLYAASRAQLVHEVIGPALLTDVSKAYKTEAQQPNSRAAYWIFRNIGYLCEETNDGDGPNRENYGKGVKQFYKAYMTKMEELQKNVNAQMLNVYKNDKKNLEYYATKLGIAIGNETMDFAKAMYMDIQTCKTNGTKYETSSLSADDIEYDLSMVTAPAKKADDTKPVTPAKPSAPARVQVRAKALKGKKVKVSLKKTAEAKGYEIVYSTNVNFTKKTTKKISTKNLTKTIKKLKKKKTYYIKARAYKLDGKTKVYGRWSLIRKVTIKK